MFLLVSGRHVCDHLDGRHYAVSIQIPINLGKKLSAYLAKEKNARVFEYLPSFFPRFWTLYIKRF